ncbi:MAG: lysophospholipid acyltransferase family protein [Burkholderiaceae bacterium]|nr:lysophospholipid acyltransferase family protein [Burkholderiaceae bacterium]
MMSFLRWLGRRPLWLLHALGAMLGWLAWWGSRRYRQRMRDNAALAGQGADTVRAAVPEAGRMIAELPRLWLRPPGRPLADPVRWDGDAWLAGLLEANRGLVLLTPHLGSFEVAAQAYAERFGERWPMTALYRPAENAFVRELEETARARPGLMTAPASVAGVRQLLRALKAGQTVGMLPDQVPPKGMGVWAPFFGQPAFTMTLAVRLARQSGAALAVLWCERLPRGRGYVVHAQPLAQPPAEDADEVAAATAINASMEAVIRQCPSQYLWSYFRYKGPSE